MPNFKGTVFESTRLFTLREFGDDAVERVLAELPHEDQRTLTELHAIGWCPVEPVLRYHHALDRIFGKGDFALCVKAGHFSAGWSFNTVLKVFLRFRSPVWLIERATSVWGRYHDTGRWHVSAQGPQRILGEIREFAVRDPAFCARLRGWLQGAVELTGGRDVAVQEKSCACHGAPHCTFSLTWRD